VGGWGGAVDRWRCGRQVVVRERPLLVLSWTLAVAGFFLVVGLIGLLRPLEWKQARLAVSGADVAVELAMVELAGLMEEAASAPAAAEASVPEAALEASELSGAVPEFRDLPEPVEVLTRDDVFQIPAAAPVESMASPQRPSPPPPSPNPPARPAAVKKSAGPSGGASIGASGGGARAGSGGSSGDGAGGAARGTGYFPTPPYPAQARSRGQQGTVQLSLVFGADGRVASASVSRSSGYSELDRAASQWVRRHWRAASGQVGTFRLPVHFKLR